MTRIEIVAIGASLGGMNALPIILQDLPKKFSTPIIVVLHRGRDSVDVITSMMQRFTHMKVAEVYDKQPIHDGTVYIAPGDYHIMVEDGHFALSLDEPVNNSRPSIDVLFESVAEEFSENCIGVILTGANKDGAKGLAQIKQQGGITIVQDPAGAESQLMPKSAIAACKVDYIVQLEEIGKLIGDMIEKPGKDR